MFAKSFVLAAALISAASPGYALSPTLVWGNGGGNGWNGGGWHSNNGGNWNNGEGWNQPQPAQVDRFTIDVGRIVGNETLRLRQLAGLGGQFNGRTLQSVVVELYPGPSARVQLLVNGQVAAEGHTNGKSQLELRPNASADTFGSEVQTLQLRTIGWASIDDIEINVLRQASWQPQPPQTACRTIERQLNTHVRFGQLSLNEMFGLSQINGCRIGSITLTGSTAAGMGQASGVVNGSETTNRVQVARQPGVYVLTFWNTPATGRNAPQVALNLAGNFTVQSVRLNLVNGGGW